MNNHFDPFMGPRLPSELKRPLRRVKTILLQKGRKLLLGIKTTLLNLQCWNHRGELKYNGEYGNTLPNTNITNLLGDSIKYRKNNKPKGYEIFTKALSDINLPEELIGNPESLQFFKTYDYEKPPDV